MTEALSMADSKRVVDPEGLLEYSVVFTDRSLNHMSQRFRQVMRDISAAMKNTYSASATVLVPGGGTYAMEAVARQFATDQSCLVIRNGWFSYRWSQIFEAGNIASRVEVLKARPIGSIPNAPFAPPPIDEVVDAIRDQRPQLLFCPHVETSSGMMLSHEYIVSIADAIHSVGGMLLLDCIASGAIWIDMAAVGVDVLITAPQKGWSGSPCCGVVLLSDSAAERMEATKSSSFACDLRAWHGIAQAYESGGCGYHATMPTDGLLVFRDAIDETIRFGLAEAEAAQRELGAQVRTLFENHGMPSVAAESFQSPAVIVSYTDDPQIRSGQKFADAGLQIAAGVPLACDEPEPFSTFRIGLFGLDKLKEIDRTVGRLERALCSIAP